MKNIFVNLLQKFVFINWCKHGYHDVLIIGGDSNDYVKVCSKCKKKWLEEKNGNIHILN